MSLSSVIRHGDADQYHAILFEANRPMLSHLDQIHPGRKLRIRQLA
jgi:nucleoid-associated protein YgaU